MRAPYREILVAEAKALDLDPLLVEAVVWQESGGRADAFRFEPAYYERYCKGQERWAGWEPRRVASSYGLMQVMYPTALDHGFDGAPEGLFDLRINLRVGCRVLQALLHRFSGNRALALGAYNGGIGNATGARPQAYARAVLARYARLESAARVGRGGQPTPEAAGGPSA